MHPQSVMELVEAERIARQLRLQNEIELDNLVGGWERLESDCHFFWSDSMFSLHEIIVPPGNLISLKEANAFIHPDDLEMVLAKREELEETGYVDYRFRLQLQHDKIKSIHAREKKIVENDAVLYRGSWQDEAMQKELQQPVVDIKDKLSIQLKIFERAEEVGFTGSWQINLETFETIYSDNVYRIYGLLPQSIPPHVDTFRKFIYPDDRTIVLQSWEKAYVEMIPLHLEYRIIREDGETRYVSQVSHLMKNGKGEHLLTGNIRDVTEQKLLELQLREANEILTLHNELFLQSEQISQLGTWQINVNTRKTVYSSNLFRLYGIKPYSILPGIQNFMQFIHPDDQEAVRDAYTKAFEAHIAPEIEFRITRNDGKTRTLRQKGRFIKTDREELLIGIVQDISDQQQKDVLLKEANQRLLVQNEAFRQAEKVADIGNWIWNLDTDEIYFSDNIYNIYGLKAQSVPPVFQSFSKYMHPDDRKWLKELPEKIRNEKEPMSVDYRIIRANGELRYLRSKNQPLTTAEGQTFIIGVTQDVTTEVLLHQQLMERIQFAELLSDTIVDRIVVTDITNNIISWNKSCENFYRQKKEHVLGKNFFDIVPQMRIPQVMERFKKALSGESVHVPVMPSPQIPGHFQELFIVPLKNESGRVIGVLHVMHDLTERFIAEQRLRTSESHLRSAQEIAIMGSFEMELPGDKLNWSDQTYRIFEYPAGMPITVNEVNARVHPDDLSSVQEALDKMKEGWREPIDNYFRIITPAGSTKHLHSRVQAFFNDEGAPIKMSGIVQDITTRKQAAEELRESQHFSREIADAAPDLLYVMDINEKKVVFINTRVKQLLGHDPTTNIFTEVVHPDDAERRMRHIDGLAHISDTDIREIDVRLRSADDSWRWFKIRDRLFKRNADGTVWQTIGAAQDITEKKNAEEQILKQQELLQQAEEIAHIGSWEFHTGTKKLLWSDEVFRIYGYAPNAFEPNPEFYFDTIHPDDRVLLRSLMDEAISEGNSFTVTGRIFTLDSELRYIHTRAKAMRDEAGSIYRIVGTMQDVTTQKLLESELRKRNQNMRNQYELDRLGENVKNVGSWQWDVASNKLLWTEKMFELFGLKPHSFMPTIEGFIDLVHPEDREKVKAEINFVLKVPEGILPEYEFRVMVNQDLKYFRVSSRKLRDGAVIGTTMEITQDALLRQELSEKIRQLEEMNEELSSFAFVASHDLREPLRKIQIFSDWLCQKETDHLSAEGLDRFNRIRAAVSRMDTLIDDILDYSRISLGFKKLMKNDLNEVLENVKNDLQSTIAETGAVIDAQGLPVIMGNKSQLMQLFQNLIGNALKYHKADVPPHIRITCQEVEGKYMENTSAAPHDHYALVSFADNGIGFDQQYAKKIFQMFQRLHGMHEYPGTGMGLAICKKILEYHNGFITASSIPGEGAVFNCYFPLHVHEITEAPAIQEPDAL